jgi:hypothetical protein
MTVQLHGYSQTRLYLFLPEKSSAKFNNFLIGDKEKFGSEITPWENQKIHLPLLGQQN